MTIFDAFCPFTFVHCLVITILTKIMQLRIYQGFSDRESKKIVTKRYKVLTIKLHQTKSFTCCMSKLIEGEESGTQNNFSDKITTEANVDLY